MTPRNSRQNNTQQPVDTKICGTEALQQLVKSFEDRRKFDAEINNSSWRLGDNKHIDSHYLGSPDLHDRLEKHRQDTKLTGEMEGYNVHFHPELHASWTYGIYGVGSKLLCEMHNERQTKQLKSGDVRYNRQLWRQGDRNSRISFGGRSLPLQVSPIKRRSRPCAFSESFIIRDGPSGHELTWNDRHKEHLSESQINYRLSKLRSSPIRKSKNKWRYSTDYFLKSLGKLGSSKPNEKIWIA